MALNHFGQYIVKFVNFNVQYTERRLYARWQGRRPSKAYWQTLPSSGSSLTEENIIDLDPKVLQDSIDSQPVHPKLTKSSTKNKSVEANNVEATESNSDLTPKNSPQIDKKKILEKREQILDARKKYLSMQKVFDDNGDIIYEKLNHNDGRVSTLLTNLKSKKERVRTGQVLVEGWRLIVDGLQAKCSLKYLMFSRTPDLDHIKPYLPKSGVKIFKVPYKEISMWSAVVTSSGLLGVFAMPTPNSIQRQGRPLPLQIICDNVRIPDNLGAILRAAVGVGCEKVLLMKGCVDLWEPKVTRSAAGAHFRLPIHSSLEWEDIPSLIDHDTSVFIADNNAKVQLSQTDQSRDPELESCENIEDLNVPILPYYGVEYSALKSITLIIGGETEGISEDCYRFAANRNGLRVNIPLQRGVDSLNTGMATAIIAFEIKKQILEAKAKDKLYNAVQ